MASRGDKELQTVVAISVELRDVQEQIRVLEQKEADLKAQLRALLKTDEGTGPVPNKSGSESLASRIVAVLDASPGTMFSPEEVSAGLKAQNIEHEVESVRSTLSRLARTNRIRNIRRGMYQSTRAPAQQGPNGAPPHSAVPAEEVPPTH